jgi:hypothetical protein
MEQYGRAGQATDDNIIRHMRFACWITKATDTHSQYIILIAFPRQQWLRERASVLCYAYIACLVSFNVISDLTKASCRLLRDTERYFAVGGYQRAL